MNPKDPESVLPPVAQQSDEVLHCRVSGSILNSCSLLFKDLYSSFFTH